MESKNTCVVSVVLWGIGMILLLAAAFDVLPYPDNTVIFFALACFIIGSVVKKILKGGGGCCK